MNLAQVRVRVSVKATAIWCGFELCECLLVRLILLCIVVKLFVVCHIMTKGFSISASENLAYRFTRLMRTI